MTEELSKFRRTGVEWEPFCPENCAAREAVFQVLRKFVSIAQGWVGKDMWRYGDTDEWSSCGDKLGCDSWGDEVDWY